jgi:hypothetical protein
MHWGGRALARRIRLPREMQTDSWVSAGTDGRFGYGPKISKMGTFKQHIMVYHGFPKRKISSQFALWNGCVIDYD